MNRWAPASGVAVKQFIFLIATAIALSSICTSLQAALIVPMKFEVDAPTWLGRLNSIDVAHGGREAITACTAGRDIVFAILGARNPAGPGTAESSYSASSTHVS